MKLTIDTDTNRLVREDAGGLLSFDLYSDDAFQIISNLWTTVGWNQKYTYTFTWLGRPVIQLPEDLMRLQEAIHRVRPDVILETGVAHGGSLIFYASLCKAVDRGRVIGVDIDIRQHNRSAIESHQLSSLITLVEGSSTSESVVARVKSLVKSGEVVFVVLDSCHTKAHVAAELEAYHDLVTAGSYMVVADTIMRNLSNVPRGHAEWASDNPAAAVVDFVKTHSDFVLEAPVWPFNESSLLEVATYCAGGWLRRKS